MFIRINITILARLVKKEVKTTVTKHKETKFASIDTDIHFII